MIAIEMTRGKATPPWVVRKVRKELSQGYGVCVVAKWNNLDESTVSRIKNGQRHAAPRIPVITIEDLHIQRTDEECPKCGKSQGLKTIRNICPVCHLKEIERQGLADFGIQ